MMKYWLFAFGLSLSLVSGGAGAQIAAPAQNPGLFTGRDAASAIESAIAREDDISSIKVSINQVRDDDIVAQGAGSITATAGDVTVDKVRNHWEATLQLQEDGRNLAPIRLAGRYEEMVAVPVLKRRIMSGEVIAEGDIEWDKTSAASMRKNTVTDPRDLIGKSPKHMLSQGRAIRLDEIANPAIVSKGAQVTMLFRSHNIEIKTFGEVLDPGAKGDVIRVRNTTSKAIIEGTVISSDEVLVSSPESNAAEVLP